MRTEVTNKRFKKLLKKYNVKVYGYKSFKGIDETKSGIAIYMLRPSSKPFKI